MESIFDLQFSFLNLVFLYCFFHPIDDTIAVNCTSKIINVEKCLHRNMSQFQAVIVSISLLFIFSSKLYRL